MALPLFAITLFVSAFLLFLVQPMIGKMILPKLGGTPQVWNTCMMFFQTALLAGYGYTHTVSTRMQLKRQITIHGVLLLLPVVFLLFLQPSPFNITGWVPPTEENPIPAALMLLAVVVGVPFFVVSTSAPLLQKWFASTGHPSAKDPYFLYGASNLGSLLSLIMYPFLVEPYFVLQTQAWIWTVGYIILAILIYLSASVVWKAPPEVQLAGAGVEPAAASEAAPAPPPVKEASTAIQPATALRGVSRKKGAKVPGHAAETAAAPSVRAPEQRSDVMDWRRRLRWILLAAVPSSLMLGVTSYVSTDLSPFPLLWVIPLALYLLSFILVFSKWPTVWTEGPHTVVQFVQPLALCAICLILLRGGFDPFRATMVSFLGFFVVACYCHGELAKDRPSTRFLTEYFLLLSVGGMVGGVFNGLFAPVVFQAGVLEYPLAIIAACLLRRRTAESGWTDDFLLKSAPDLERWAQDKGDEMAVAFGGQPRRSTYLINYFFDIVLALVVLGIAWWLRERTTAWNWHPNYPAERNGIVKILKFLGFSTATAAEWREVAYGAFVFGPVLIMAFFMAVRPLRFGLAIAAILLANLYFVEDRRDTVYAGRSYFGVLRVNRDEDFANGHVEEHFVPETQDGVRRARFHFLMHGTTYHGRNYYDPPELSRLATTYYHRWGPVGIVMERYNWFPGPQNTYGADNRMPASMVGLGATSLGLGNLPLNQICNVWSEPPIATIGLGTGTVASYGRPLQHVVYYEIDEKIRNFSLPLDGRKAFFTYLQGAMKRGSNLEVIMGDARQAMQRATPAPRARRDALAAGQELAAVPEGIPQKNSLFHFTDDRLALNHDVAQTDSKGNMYKGALHPEREKYYMVIVVDAFSSDAIPIHLTTKEAIELYMDQLQDEGVLCMHTSNRHMDLTKPIVDIADALGLAYVVGHDPGSERRRNAKAEYASMGHFSSEYVMISRSKTRLNIREKKGQDGTIIRGLEKILLNPQLPPNPNTNPVVSMDESKFYGDNRQWYIPNPAGMRLWTDDFSNIISILR
ncbi:MAG: hypothetical protein L0Y71_06745 [Gemmataceae bacterium]|nr:hypothetical protein [Gemmataceae bacterium]